MLGAARGRYSVCAVFVIFILFYFFILSTAELKPRHNTAASTLFKPTCSESTESEAEQRLVLLVCT